MDSLYKYKRNVTSQWGEDGIIEEIFKRIGHANGSKDVLCVEFGAWDGKHMSNTWNLWHEKAWSALLIEGNKQRCSKLKEDVKNYPKVIPYQAYVEKNGANSLDAILEKLNVKEVSLLSIDIDGDDYYILESLKIKPSVIIIEYNPTIPPSISMVQKLGEYFGSSAKAIMDLAKIKGYSLSAITETNCIFVRDSEFPKLDIQPVDLEREFPSKHLTYLFSSYDGKTFPSRKSAYAKPGKMERAAKGLKRRIKKIPGFMGLYKKLWVAKSILIWKIKGKPAPAPHKIKEKIVIGYGKRFGAKILVETGTYMGEMIEAGVKYFQQIISIELDKSLASQAQAKFSNRKNISVLQGDSTDLLLDIVKNLSGKTIFWLDAHYSGGITAKGKEHTPILSEIKTISSFPQENTVLLIDDARCFIGKNGYPVLSDFKEYVMGLFPNHTFEVSNDIMRIYPKN